MKLETWLTLVAMCIGCGTNGAENSSQSMNEGGSASGEAPECSDESSEELFGTSDNSLEAVNAVDKACAGNDNGRVVTFEVAAFDAEAALEYLKEADRKSSGVDCSDQRKYSKSRENGVALFLEHITSDWTTSNCLAEEVETEQVDALKALVSDPSNIGVFASVFRVGEGDNPEACDYYNFHVYRADGVLIELTFNHTD